MITQFSQGFGDCFGFRLDLQLVVNVSQVKRDGVGREFNLNGGDFVVVVFDRQLATRSEWGVQESKKSGSGVEHTACLPLLQPIFRPVTEV